MRLHRLTLAAFQPFATTETVDFDALGDGGLFLMQGETGAGKTAILDGVCFALFGRVPGARDSAPRLRSDHSSGDVRTEVVLELTIGGRRLRITRSPKQERAKLRGEGTTEEPARATLEAVDPDGTRRVIAERIEAVEHELDELLGLTITQFCQVVMLPQGAFARFLHAGTDERERLLAQLFDTDRYAAAQEWLAEARRDADIEVHRGLDAVGDIASRIAQVAHVEPPEEWREAPASMPEWLAGLLVVAEAEQTAAEGRRAHAATTREAAAAAHRAAVELAARQAELADARAELARREEAAERRTAAVARLERARRAAPAAALAAQADAAESALSADRQTVEAALALAGVEPEVPAAQLTLEAEPYAPPPQIEAGLARERAAEHRRAAALARACSEDEARLSALAAELESRRAGAVTQAKRAATVQEWLAGADAERAELTTALDRARAALAEAPGAQARFERAAERASAAERRDILDVRQQSERAVVEQTRTAELDARQNWLDARERRLEGIASELAADLSDGEPCRVCGALEHPSPAAAPEGAVVSPEIERELGERVDRAAGAHAAAREVLAATEQELSAARAVSGAAAVEALMAEASAAAQAASEVEKLAAQEPDADRRLAAHATQIERRQADLATAREAAARLGSEIETAERELTAARERVEAARAGFATIDARLGWLDERAQALESAAEALERLEHARGEHTRRLAAARDQALLAGFASAQDALDAALDPEEAEALEQRIEAHDDALIRLRALVAEPELVAAGAAPAPDLEAAATVLREADAELEAAAQGLALTGTRARELHALSDELDARLGALAPRLERRELVRNVASLADGSSQANRLRMPLSAYVLTARLEQIAEAASVRLERMSGGRYVLAHCDERVGRSRKGGLGLEVRDAWTGRERPPSSLSGGETFQASLALALGLADVVSAEAGGARLETLFVDEGFGTLGDHALDGVLDVLDGLREGGRAVGVISHVSELRQRIPVQLHVEKGREGSRIRQRVGVG